MASKNTNTPESADMPAEHGDDPAKANDSPPELPTLSRRKLAYVAPALASRAMFYGAAGCGKGDPRLFACIQLRRGSS